MKQHLIVIAGVMFAFLTGIYGNHHALAAGRGRYQGIPLLEAGYWWAFESGILDETILRPARVPEQLPSKSGTLPNDNHTRDSKAKYNAYNDNYNNPPYYDFLTLNLPSLTLKAFHRGKLVKEYQVAIGKPSDPTPIGDFTVVNKVVNPTWYPTRGPMKGIPVPPGPANPLGSRWIGLDAPGYGIHGNNPHLAPNAIGHAVSLGCVRMNNKDIEELFEKVQVGTKVIFSYDLLDVEFDQGGTPYFRLYSDIYNRGGLDRTYLTRRLRDALKQRIGDQEMWVEFVIEGYLTSELIDRYMTSLARQGEFVTLGQVVEVNGKFWTTDALEKAGDVMVPLKMVRSLLGGTVRWDAHDQIARFGRLEVPGWDCGGRIYLSLTIVADARGWEVLRTERGWALDFGAQQSPASKQVSP